MYCDEREKKRDGGVAPEGMREAGTSDKLKPCGSCGSVEAEIGIIGGATFWVECSACGACSSSHDDEYDAIAAWNNRPIEDKLQNRIDALKASGIEALRRAEVAEQERDTYKAKVNALVAENRLAYSTLQRVFSQYTALLRNCDLPLGTQTVNDAIAVLRRAGMPI